MTYQINPHVDLQNHLRCHRPERYYVDQLAARGALVRLGNVAVDAEELILRPFKCDPAWCLHRQGEGATLQYKQACCTDLEVDLTPEEVDRLRRLGALARERLTFAASDPLGEVAERLESGRFTRVTEQGETALEHRRSGRCPLSWLSREGVLRCAVNTLCARLKRPLEEFKPDPCILFPLHFVEYEPGQYLLTLITEQTHEYIGADAYVTRLRCLKKPVPDAPPAYVWLHQEIVHCFGEPFYAALAQAAEPVLLHERRIQSEALHEN